ncbi:glucosaminidase domain-containing protein [Brumimicrobium mesophilum]|uniref:glucosaminidase domain-containing protein n=1 Tax=Brumimicrobium mesophilum TaxID=392717 RepID=UPI000D142D3D|nr:glucosaminidase domain-containing protein [Brumimicrobium mesophilum]
MNRFLAMLTLTFFSLSALGNNSPLSLEQYIEKWKDVAMNQMLTHGIPASITLSQGILESGFGNSKLAVKANNHFGIKCHDWKGDTYKKHDDKRNECFRKYDDAAQSFEDHSTFLTTRSRYASLFELEITDYKSWAKGLKEAGYATNPQYPRRLIDIIERYNLDQYDILATSDWIVENKTTSDQPKKEIEIPSGSKVKKVNNSKPENSQKTNQFAAASKHTVFTNKNRTKYVIAGKHDTFYLISKELGLSLNQLHKWNDFPPTKDILSEGDKIYIMRKRRKIDNEVVQFEINQNKKLWEIAQEHGVQLKILTDMRQSSNNVAMSKDEVMD